MGLIGSDLAADPGGVLGGDPNGQVVVGGGHVAV